MKDLLKKYELPADLKTLSHKELKTLADEIRKYIIKNITETGGHLASSLGVVELSIALHSILHSPEDKIIWDVGHQCYPHKLLTGRDIKNIRQHNGLSGFLSRNESKHDIFGAGHASTSISAALGIAHARDIQQQDFAVFAIIGDSSLSGGLAFEGLNNSDKIKGNFVVILNDNEMSISEPVGALSKTITGLRLSKLYTGLKKNTEKLLKMLPFIGKPLAQSIEKLVARTGEIVIHETSAKEISGFFQDLGFTYLGPIDGHDLPLLMSAISYSKNFKKGPLLLHVKTKKGFGFQPAEENPTKYHGISCNQGKSNRSYTEIFGQKICELAEQDKRIIAITAAMVEGTGLKQFKEQFPERFFDVGIAEGHAVTFAGGLAVQGMKPFVAIYSSFMQRAYDQLIHDIALQKLPVTFILDRAGLVGEDGPTHHGAYDISFLRTIPNLIISAPKDFQELEDLMLTALGSELPFVIRIPKGPAFCYQESRTAQTLEVGSWEIMIGDLSQSSTIVIATGRMVEIAHNAINKLGQKDICLINARFIKPLDQFIIRKLQKTQNRIIILEEGTPCGGLTEAVKSQLVPNNISGLSLPDDFVGYGNVHHLLDSCYLSEEAVLRKIQNG